MYLVLYPASFINAYAQVRDPFPSVKFLIIFALLALLLFYFAHIQRLNFWSGIEADLIIVSEISKFQINTIYEILNQIFIDYLKVAWISFY